MVAANREQRLPSTVRQVGAEPLFTRFGARVAHLAAVPFAVGLGVLAVEDAFELGSILFVMVLTVAFCAAVVLLLIGLRDLRLIEARTRTAHDRAAAAEAAQRARADELARVLEASTGLALTGEGQVDYLRVLEAIAPAGVTSFLVRIESDGNGAVVAAHGPSAASLVGLVRPMGTGAGSDLRTAPIASFSASGHPAGVTVPREHLSSFDCDIAAALAIRLVDHSGRCLGWLHLIDHQEERILEPVFVNLAQLVANQIAVAMENHALLASVRHQLGEVQRVQQQLVQASKLSAIGELASAVAHEVNNPLTGILGFSELLMSELPEDDPRHDEATVIHDEAVRARTIVRSLLEFARPRPPQRLPTDLNEAARSTLELLAFRASDADVTIESEFVEMPLVALDPDAFQQVLLNLFNNAIDAMPHGGKLSVRTIVEPDRVGVMVADAGVGMSRETRTRIFTPFFSNRTGGGGAGLGLSVSLQIVENHGGSIDVTSTPGQGAVFTVWLPRTLNDSEGVLIPSTDEVTVKAPEGVVPGARQGVAA